MRSAKAGLWNEAVFRWERALLDHPSDPRLHNNLGIAYEHEGRYEEARKEYQRALDLDPENAYIKKNIEAFENFYKKNKLKGPGQDDSAAGEDAEKHAS
ncbi:MAG: tetratricopeptide repeat protein [Acidobacteriota bacterium]